MKSCSLCSSREYLIDLTPVSFDIDVPQNMCCVPCVTFAIRCIFGKDYIKVLEKFKELDELKYQINQKRYSLDCLIEDSLDRRDTNE